MRAEAYYNRGNGWERVAGTFADSKNDVFDVCQKDKGRTLDGIREQDRSMMPGDIIVVGEQAWIVDRVGFDEIEIVEAGEKHIDEIEFTGPEKTPIDHDRELGVV